MSFSVKNWNSLHFRLLRIVAYSLAIAIVISGSVLLFVGNIFVKESTISDLKIIGNILAENTAFQLGLEDQFYQDEAAKTLETARYHGDINLVCLYKISGELYAEYAFKSTKNTCSPNTTIVASEYIRSGFISTSVSLPVFQDNTQLGHITVQSNGYQLKEALSLLILILFATFGLSLIIAFFIGRRMVSTSLNPLKALSSTSEIIAQNPLAEARATKVHEDEVGSLVDVFNSMLDGLATESKNLKSSEIKFRSLSENAPVGVFLRNDTKNYQYVNGTWRKLTGLDTDNANLFTQHIDSQYEVEYFNRNERLANHIQATVLEFEFICPNGDRRFFMEYVSKVSDESGSLFVGSLLDVTDLKHAQLELEQLAYYDPLTKLPNRRFLRDHLSFALAKAKKENRKIAVFMTDLDDFKKVNDSLGHDAGDKLLKEISEKLRKAVFEEDVVARMGGDEFMILVEEEDNLNSLEMVSKRLLKAMSTHAEYEHVKFPVTGSLGVAIYPDDATTYEELLRFSDLALYSSKEKGGNAFSCYSSDLDHKIREQIRIEQKLRAALSANALEVFLQPLYDSSNMKMCWAEALVRWFDKDEGSISPGVFIPVAENTGLIHPLGDFVLERVVQILSREAKSLNKLGIKGISVNLSAKQFYSRDLVKRISTLLEEHNVSASKLGLEITESMVMDDIELAIAIMNDINALGCSLSIDDFGTGYSSLTYLKRFPVDSLKIDQSFIRDLPEDKSDAEIACAIIDLAHNLGMQVVAEGVETRRQADFLAEKGSEFLQGFLLSRPVSVEELKLQLNEPKQQNSNQILANKKPS